MKKKTIAMIFIGIVIIAISAFPRAIEVCNGNFIFGFDQGKHWLAAKSMVVDHALPLIGDEVGGGGGFFQGPGWYYTQAIPFLLFQGNPYGQLVLMFIIGIATVGCSYIIFSSRFGYSAGFFISFLVALSPAISIQSRFSWPPFVIPFITIFYIDALYKIVKGEMRSWFTIFFLLGCMANFEIATAATLGVATCLALFVLRKVTVRSIGFGLLGFAIPLLPLLAFDIRHQFLNARGIWHMITTTSAGNGTAALAKIWEAHVLTFSVNLFGAFPIFSFKNIFILLCIASSILLFFDKRVSKTHKLFITGLIFIPCIIFLELLFYTSTLWEWWLLELPIFYIVLVGLLSSYIFSKRLVGKIIIIILYAYVFSKTVPYVLETWKKDYPDYGGTQKIKGKTEAVEAIFQDAKGQPFGVLVFTPPVYTYPYDYLFWWIGTKKYKYVPYTEKRGLFYLLIEPDPEKPWSYKGWLETVIQDGTIISTRQLPSGFIIEKRMAQ